MGTFYESLASRCYEKDRPVYFLKQLGSIISNGEQVLFRDFEASGNAKIYCTYIPMLDHGCYQAYKEINPLRGLEQRDYLEDVYGGHYDKSEQIDLKNIEAIFKDGRHICIIAENLVLSSMDFSKELMAEQRKVDREKHEKHLADQLKEAIKSGSTLMKRNLQTFCKQHDIDFIKPKGILGTEELSNISRKLEETLEAHGLSYRNLDRVPQSIFDECIENARTVRERVEQQQMKEKARTILNQLTALNKPLISAYKMMIFDNNNIVSSEKLTDKKNIVVNMSVHGDPTNLYRNQYDAKREMLDLKGLTVIDVIDIGNGGYAVVSDHAVFIKTPDHQLDQELSKIYKEYMQEKNITPINIRSHEGIIAAMSEHVTQCSGGLLTAARWGLDPIVQYEQVENFCEDPYTKSNAAAVMNSGVYLIDANNNVITCAFENLYPGAKFALFNEGARDMASGKYLGRDYIYTVQDIAEVDGKTVVVTDRGVFCQQDISKQLHIEKESQDFNQTIGDKR